MPSWRIEDLDREEPRRRARVVDPMELVGLVVAALVAISLVPGIIGTSTTTAPAPGTATPAPTATPRATPIASTLSLSARQLDVGDCGAFSAGSPPPTFAGATPRYLRRIDEAVSLSADRSWTWCVAGARVYEDGIELLGKFVRSFDPAAGDRPRAVLRGATFGAQIQGYGALGPSELVRATDGFTVLRLRAVSDNRRRLAFRNASERVDNLILRITAMSGPWTFASVPLADGPLDIESQAAGVSFRLRDLKLLPNGLAATAYGRDDTPDPALVMMEWEAADDVGTVYRGTPEGDALPSSYRAFEPAPPAVATSLSLAIRRIYLAPLREFAVTLPLLPPP